MTHLTDSEIARLADLEQNLGLYEDADIEMLEHLKECQECYDKYLVMRAICEVVDGTNNAIWEKCSAIDKNLTKELNTLKEDKYLEKEFTKLKKSEMMINASRE